MNDIKNRALIYKDFSDAYETRITKPNFPVKINFRDIDFSNKIIIANGKSVNPDYIVQDGDIIIIRSVPHAATTIATIAIISAIIAGTALVAGAVYVGYQLYKLKKQVSDLEDATTDLDTDITNVAYLAGASNSVATGKTQPYVMGRHLFTPYLLTSSFSELSGTDGVNQYYYAVLEMGFNSQILRKLYVEDYSLKNWGDSLAIPQEGIYTFDTDSIFYTADSLVEVGQDGADLATANFNIKKGVEKPSASLGKADDDDYTDLTYTLDDYSRNADICILFNGLLAYDDDGNEIARSVTVVPYYSLNSGSTWTAFTFDQNGTASNTFSRSTKTQLRFNAHVDFVYSAVHYLTSPVLIKLVCTTGAYDGTAYDDVTVLWVQSTIYDPDASDKAGYFVNEKVIDNTERALSCVVGLKIKATAANEDYLTKINAITQSIARTWDSDTSAWSTTKYSTSNPAAILLEVLTSETHVASQMDDSEIDLDSFGAAYEYCVTNNLHYNRVLTDGDTKQTIIEDICASMFASLYQDIYGKSSIVIDKENDSPIGVLNTQNVISWENKKDMSRLTDGIKISYTSNANDNFVTDTYLVMRDGVTRSASSILREMTITGIEEYEHIVKYARRLMAIEKLRPNTVTAKVGREGVYYTMLGKLLVQHPSLKIGLGSAEIQSIIDDGTYITGLVLYDAVEYDSTDTDGFGMVIQCVSDTYCTPLSAAYTASSDGLVKTITFTDPILLTASVIPHPGDTLSYGYLDSGEFDTITSPMLITGIEPDDEGFELTLVDYNTNIYDVGTIDDYTPNITTRKKSASTFVGAAYATKDEAATAVSTAGSGTPTTPTDVVGLAGESGITLSCTTGSSGLKDVVSTVEWQIRASSSVDWDDAYSVISYTGSSSYTFDHATQGYLEASYLASWQVRCRVLNKYAIYSEWSAVSNVDTTDYGTWIVDTPQIVPNVLGRSVILTLSESATTYGTIRYRVQINQENLDGDTYYKPNLTSDPYDAETNYKDGTGYVISSATFNQTLPLTGQETGTPTATTYRYSVVAYNEASESDANVQSVVALATESEITGTLTINALDDTTFKSVFDYMGMKIKQLVSSVWNTIAEVIVDKLGNMILSNDPDNIPDLQTFITDGYVLPLDGTITDEDGNTPTDVTVNFTEYLTDDPAIEGKSYLHGNIERDTSEGAVVIEGWNKSDKLIISDTAVNLNDGTTGDCLAKTCNDNASTDWGLTSTQVSNKIFKAAL